MRNTRMKESYFKSTIFALLIFVMIAVIASAYFFKPQAKKEIGVIPSIVPYYNLTVVPITKDMTKAVYTKIPGTDLELKIPDSYKQRKNEKNAFLSITPLISANTDIALQEQDVMVCQDHLWDNPSWKNSDRFAPYISQDYCKALLATNPRVPNPFTNPTPNTNSFYIANVATTSSANNWVLDTFHPQGVDLRKDPTWTPKMKQVLIHQRIFYTYILGCCAGGETVYFYPYTYKNKQMLLLFINVDMLPKLTLPDPFLNTILATLGKSISR